ncbi:unnamed protein product [Ambrosiozyma monospora]|uniref:Unnamed protein product n=1 Tax=Ambrosiozyma monospora TaxID=43982 RepID=A0A9W7DKZ1_AMBMO|nr:unnamed protein product [Ambrosiozyma monospora]
MGLGGGGVAAPTTPNIPQFPNKAFSASPALQFERLIDEQRKTGVGAAYKFSPFVSGEMSALITPEVIRRWRYDVVPPLPSELRSYKTSMTQAMQENPSFNPTRTGYSVPEERLYVATIHDVMTKYERVISFDYAPNLSAPYGIDLVCMRQSGSVYKMSVVETQTAIAFNSYNDLTFSGAVGTCTKLVIDELKLTPLQKTKSGAGASDDEERGHADGEVSNENGGGGAGGNKTNAGIAGASVGTGIVDHRGSIDTMSSSESDLFISTPDSTHWTSDAALQNDICSTIRKRAMLGYSTFANKNMEVLDNIKTIETQGQLRNTWKWIDISYGLISSGKMIANEYDFGYLGVLGIWNMTVSDTESHQARFNGPGRITRGDLMGAARKIVENRSKEIRCLATPLIGFQGRSEKEIERRLAMYVIGWDFAADELEEKYAALTDSGNFERAAGLAVFHGDITRATMILGQSKKENFRIMSTAIAAYTSMGKTAENNSWKDHCRELSSDLDDPYLRAIFAYIADANWYDVLDDSSLPLRERLGVALRFLNDKELNSYLNKVAETVIEREPVMFKVLV